jgi:acetyl-CoA carboxylase alpha subunit
MANTFSYRPKSYSVAQLKKIAQKHHTNLNRYIETAIVEKIANEQVVASQDEVEQLAQKIKKVVVEHMGVRLTRPDKKTHRKINAKFEQTQKSDLWVSDDDARPERS